MSQGWLINEFIHFRGSQRFLYNDVIFGENSRHPSPVSYFMDWGVSGTGNKSLYSGSGSACTGYLAGKPNKKIVILLIDFREDIFPVHFIQKVKVTPLNQFRELQIFRLFSCQISCTGTAGTGIQILGSCSAHPYYGPLLKMTQIVDHQG